VAARLTVLLLKVSVAVPILGVVANCAAGRHGVFVPGFSDGPL
jgi:hypothetical protein